MKKFIIKLIFFIIIFIPIAILVDITVSNILKRKPLYMGEMEVWTDIFEGNINAQIAIYGSSRAWVHFNPAIFEEELNINTYNFGIDGHNFWLQYLRHKLYFKYNPHPKIIIYSVDVFLLEKIKELYNKNQFLPYMLWNKDIYEFTNSYKGFTWADYYIPLKRYFGRINILEILLTSKKIRYKGFQGQDLSWNNDLKNARKNKPNFKVKLDTQSVRLFHKFIRDMQKQKIKIILVYAPEYIEGQDFVKNRAEIIHFFQNIAQKYNIIFMDYSNHKISHNKDLFYNSLHLNRKGADIFTRQFIKDAKKDILSIFNNK